MLLGQHRSRLAAVLPFLPDFGRPGTELLDACESRTSASRSIEARARDETLGVVHELPRVTDLTIDGVVHPLDREIESFPIRAAAVQGVAPLARCLEDRVRQPKPANEVLHSSLGIAHAELDSIRDVAHRFEHVRHVRELELLLLDRLHQASNFLRGKLNAHPGFAVQFARFQIIAREDHVLLLGERLPIVGEFAFDGILHPVDVRDPAAHLVEILLHVHDATAQECDRSQVDDEADCVVHDGAVDGAQHVVRHRVQQNQTRNDQPCREPDRVHHVGQEVDDLAVVVPEEADADEGDEPRNGTTCPLLSIGRQGDDTAAVGPSQRISHVLHLVL